MIYCWHDFFIALIENIYLYVYLCKINKQKHQVKKSFSMKLKKPFGKRELIDLA